MRILGLEIRWSVVRWRVVRLDRGGQRYTVQRLTCWCYWLSIWDNSDDPWAEPMIISFTSPQEASGWIRLNADRPFMIDAEIHGPPLPEIL